jgi:hypothetical protein
LLEFDPCLIIRFPLLEPDYLATAGLPRLELDPFLITRLPLLELEPLPIFLALLDPELSPGTLATDLPLPFFGLTLRLNLLTGLPNSSSVV